MAKAESTLDRDDPGQAHIARVLTGLLWGMIAINSLLTPIEAVVMPAGAARSLTQFLAVNLTGALFLVLNRRKYTRLASYLLVAFGLSFGIVMAWTGGGIHAPAVQIFPLFIFVSGLLLSWQAGAVVGAICVVVELGFVVAELHGVLPPSAVTHTPVGLWVFSVLFISLLLLFQYMMVENINRALQAARQELAQRKKAEEILRESEERFRSLSNATLEGIMFHDQGLILDANQAFARLFGYSKPEELIGRNGVKQLIAPESQARILERIQREECGPLEITAVRKDGSTFAAETESQPMTFFGRAARVVACRDISERKRAEKALRDSELKYRTLADNTRDIIYQLSADGTVTYVSPQILRYGFTVEEVTGMKIGQYCHPDDRAKLLAEFRAMIGEDKPALIQYRIISGTGEIFWMEANGRAILDADGKIVGATGILRDISERKTAEENLLQSEERYRLLFRNNPMSMWVYDLDSLAFLAVNATAIREYGYSETEFLAMTVHEIVPPQDVLILDQFLLTLQDAGHRYSQRALRKKNGDVINVEINSDALIFNGKRARLILAHDITDRVRAEEALRASEERYQLAVAGSTAGLWDWNLVTNYVYYSPRFKELLGYTDSEFEDVFASLQNALHPDDRDAVTGRLNRHLRDKTPFDIEYRLHTKAGEYRWFNSRGQALWNIAGQPYRMAGSLVDINDRKLAAQELHASRAQLELLSRQLLAAQEAERRHIARELHDEIGQVLTAISINLHAVKSVCVPSAVQRIEDGIAIVDHAIQQVRNMSLDLRPTILDDFGLIAAARWYLDRQASRAGIPIHFEAELHVARLPSDTENACFRVIQEAITNIVRHARARNVWVQLRQDGGILEIDVRDDGRGFDVKHARKRASEGGSTGLLSMQERVELLGGRFTIDSTLGVGTLVRVRLSIGDFSGDTA